MLDSNVPGTFAALLPGHLVQTAQQRRRGDLDDRPLLDACEAAGFEAFVTADQELNALRSHYEAVRAPWLQALASDDDR